MNLPDSERIKSELNIDQVKMISRSVAQSREYTDKIFSDIKNQQEQTKWFIGAILVVLLIAVIQLIIDSYRFNASIYNEYQSRLKQNSAEVQIINKKLDLILNQKSNSQKQK